MQSGRRSFFGTIIGGTAAAELLANVPEPTRVERIEPSEKSVYVLTMPCLFLHEKVRDEAFERIQQCWKQAFAPNPAPKLLFLEEGMTLQQLALPNSAV